MRDADDDDDYDNVKHKSGIWGLFRYASRGDVCLMVVGLVFSVLHGASFPVLALVFGQMTNTFIVQATHHYVKRPIDTLVSDTFSALQKRTIATLVSDKFSALRKRTIATLVSDMFSALRKRTIATLLYVKRPIDTLVSDTFSALQKRTIATLVSDKLSALRKRPIDTLGFASNATRVVNQNDTESSTSLLDGGLVYSATEASNYTAAVNGRKCIHICVEEELKTCLEKPPLSTRDQDSNPDLSVISSLVYCGRSGFEPTRPSWMNDQLSPEEFRIYMSQFSLYYLAIGAGVLVAAFVQTLCWELACEHQVYRLRQIFFAQMLRQDISWYDKNQSGDLTIKLSDDLERVREGVGAKFSMVLQYISTFVSGLVVGLIANWLLTLVILSVGPILIATSAYMAKMASSSAAREQLKYSIAGGIAEEVLSSIRTVAAFGGQEKEVHRYKLALERGLSLAMKKYYVLSLGIGGVFLVTYGAYGLAFWYGAELVGSGKATPGSVFTVLFSVMTGAFSLGNALPFVNAVSTAVGAASTIFDIIDRVPDINPYSTQGDKPDKVKGHIQFKNICFAYPARHEVQEVALRVSHSSLMSSERMKPRSGDWAGYNTLVGDKGAQLSGGQKQRVAIARALVRDPKILLLDEATSALDAHSEGIVQDALDKAMQGRTTIIIAHRLSTIRNADMIYALKVGIMDGAVVEWGTHSDLMMKQGLYHDLVTTQTTDHVKDDLLSSGEVSGIETGLRQRRHEHKSLSSLSVSSLQDPDLEHLVQEVEESKPEDVSFLRILRFNSPEWLLLLAGCFACMVVGSVMPIFAFFYGEVFATFTLTGEQLKSAALFWTLMFIVLAIVSGLSMWLEVVCMASAAEKMVLRLRLEAFANILRQPVGWFDLETSSPGRLITRLARDAPLVKSAAGMRAGQVLGALVTLVAAMLIAFLYGWKLALLLMVAVPVISFAGYQQMLVIRRNQRRDAELMNEAGRVASESVQNVRTVQALGKELLFCEIYLDSLIAPYLEAKKQAILFGVVYSVSQAVIYMMYAGAFRFAAYLIENGDMDTTNKYMMELSVNRCRGALLVDWLRDQDSIQLCQKDAIEIQLDDENPAPLVFFALAFCAASVGQTAAYLQDFSKAKMAAGLLFQLINRKSEIEISSNSGIKPELQGKVSFKDVHFKYPSRPDVMVLQGLNFTLNSGQTLALVGASGCGKSTVVALLERFYDPTRGTVAREVKKEMGGADNRKCSRERRKMGEINGGRMTVDDFNTQTLNLPYLRSHIGLVTQEPVLFDCSIKDNIAYGSLEEVVKFADIKEAARKANIHDFILGLPERPPLSPNTTSRLKVCLRQAAMKLDHVFGQQRKWKEEFRFRLRRSFAKVLRASICALNFTSPLGYNTMVGERGTQLSGGQKQRVAIARALVRDPKILLLDEATSALDTESEKVVQEALDRAREGRTCITIAHRLSTIQNADCIAVIHKGRIVEQGTHEELKNLHKRYYQLIKRQRL
uniref:(California timema) hypothetical protein n=1 Tax=Timema californicum TaxID=61474 RepID=A0A7R9J267_TIMCA|nr:unnamed protein product [Timema californicum]